MAKLLGRSGGYRRLLSYQVARLTYDVTVRFCDRYVSKRSRTHDQMVQAARSGVQNIVEGSVDSATSKKSELKLTGVARGSLGELIRDYEDFLRHNRLQLWEGSDARRQALVDRRCQSADEVAEWVRQVAWTPSSTPSTTSTPSTPSNDWARYAGCSANAGHTLACVAFGLVDRQLRALAERFEREGGFTERMYRVRKERQAAWRS